MKASPSSPTPAKAIRRERRSVVVMAGDGRTSDRGARALAQSLADAGTPILYLGRARSAQQIAHAAAEAEADAVELCLPGAGGVMLIRELLRELNGLGRRHVSLVVHRVQ
jgi:methylmalonyl-CoA mutase cobalamin-binding domain/chain